MKTKPQDPAASWGSQRAGGGVPKSRDLRIRRVLSSRTEAD